MKIMDLNDMKDLIETGFYGDMTEMQAHMLSGFMFEFFGLLLKVERDDVDGMWCVRGAGCDL